MPQLKHTDITEAAWNAVNEAAPHPTNTLYVIPCTFAALEPYLSSREQFYKAYDAYLFISNLEHRRNPEMAVKRKQRQYEPPEMINYTLDSAEKKRFQKWYEENVGQLTELLAEFIAEDWKMGITYDVNNATYIASATQKAETHDDYNVCVTARHAEWHTAMMLVYFKVKILLSGAALAQARKESDWG